MEKKYQRALLFKKNKNYNEYFKILITLSDLNYQKAADELDTAFEKDFLKQTYTPELESYYRKMIEKRNYNLTDDEDLVFNLKTIFHLKALEYKKQGAEGLGDYFKTLVDNADNDYDLSGDELDNAYEEELHLGLTFTPEMAKYYQKATGEYAKEHLEYMIETIKDKARDYHCGIGDFKKSILKAIKLYKQSIEMGDKSSLNELGFIYDREFIYDKEKDTNVEIIENNYNEMIENKFKAIDLYERSIRAGNDLTDGGSDMSINNLLDLLIHNKNKRTLLISYIKKGIKKDLLVKELEKENKRLKEKIIHLEYQPGGPKFKKLQRNIVGKMRK